MKQTEQTSKPEYKPTCSPDCKKLVEIALNIGDVMLKHGAETYRVEDTMRRILSCSPCCQTGSQGLTGDTVSEAGYRDAYVTYTGIMVTLELPGGETITKVKRIENGGANYNKLYLANNLSRKLCAGTISLEEAEGEIRRIRESRIYPEWVVGVSTVLIAAMFAVLFGGGLGDCLAAGLNGVFIIVARQLVGQKGRLQLPAFIETMLISLGMAYLTRLLLSGVELAGWPGSIDQGTVITSSIMPLVPGVAITNAIRDTLQGDYMSGGSRAMEAFVTAAGIAVGIGIGLILFRIMLE